jgi:hypothetical protein
MFSQNNKITCTFKRLRKIAKSDYLLRLVCLSVRMGQTAATGQIFMEFDKNRKFY